MSPRLTPRTDDRGVTAVEYALIVFLVGIAMLMGVVLMTRSFSAAFAASADSAAGPTYTPPPTSSAPAQPDGDEGEDDSGDGHDDGHEDDRGGSGADALSKPGAPTGVTAERSATGEITVSWKAPSNSGSKAITGYVVEFEVETQAAKCDSSVPAWDNGSATAGPTAKSSVKSGLGSTWYCVRVYAANGVPSGATNYAYAGPVYSGADKPGAPNDVKAVRSADGEITVSWTAPNSDGGSSITGYIADFQKVVAGATCDASVTGWGDGSASASGSATSVKEDKLSSSWYCVRLAASNGSAEGVTNFGYAGPVYSSTPTRPGAPTNVNGTSSGEGQVSVTWEAPATDGGQAITSYTVEFEKDDIKNKTACGAALSYDDGKASVGSSVYTASNSKMGDNLVCVRISAGNGVTSGTPNFAYVKVDATKKR